jgi:hypothetical protein
MHRFVIFIKSKRRRPNSPGKGTEAYHGENEEEEREPLRTAVGARDCGTAPQQCAAGCGGACFRHRVGRGSRSDRSGPEGEAAARVPPRRLECNHRRRGEGAAVGCNGRRGRSWSTGDGARWGKNRSGWAVNCCWGKLHFSVQVKKYI